ASWWAYGGRGWLCSGRGALFLGGGGGFLAAVGGLALGGVGGSLAVAGDEALLGLGEPFGLAPDVGSGIGLRHGDGGLLGVGVYGCGRIGGAPGSQLVLAADGERLAGGELDLLALGGELGLHEEDDLLRRLLGQLGAPGELVGRELEDGLGRVAADVLEAGEDLGRDGVGELVDVDVLLVGADVAVDVELVAGELGGEADVLAAAADGHRDLVGRDGDAGAGRRELVVQFDGDGLGRRQRALDELDGVRRPRDHVDVLVAELADDGVDAAPLHADAGADGVDAVVVAHDGHLRAVARLADDLLDLDDAV